MYPLYSRVHEVSHLFFCSLSQSLMHRTSISFSKLNVWCGKEAEHLGLSLLVSICLQCVIHMGSFRKQESAELQVLAVGCHTRVGTQTSSIFKLDRRQQTHHWLVLDRDRGSWMILLSNQLLLIRLMMTRPEPLNYGEKRWVKPCTLDLSLRLEVKGNHAPLLLSKSKSCFHDDRISHTQQIMAAKMTGF